MSILPRHGEQLLTAVWPLYLARRQTEHDASNCLAAAIVQNSPWYVWLLPAASSAHFLASGLGWLLALRTGREHTRIEPAASGQQGASTEWGQTTVPVGHIRQLGLDSTSCTTASLRKSGRANTTCSSFAAHSHCLHCNFTTGLIPFHAVSTAHSQQGKYLRRSKGSPVLPPSGHKSLTAVCVRQRLPTA